MVTDDSMSQIQCPNCGGYKTQHWLTGYIHPTTRLPVRPRDPIWPYKVVLWFGLFDLVLIAAMLFSSETRPMAGGNAIILAFAGAVFGYGYLRNQARPRPDQMEAHCANYCEICGYQWESIEGDPPPPSPSSPPSGPPRGPNLSAEVRADLIRKGNELLEEEREALD